ncbi:hypothetical protein GCM10027610_137110 [Dactylosporangium cerinum]
MRGRRRGRLLRALLRLLRRLDRARRRGPPAGDPARTRRRLRLRPRRAARRLRPPDPARPAQLPHNPTGKVFTPDELQQIAALCEEFDAVAVTDEVYEHLVFTDADAPHVPIASLPGMRARTLQISSAGKTFSCTGWKIGWICGPRDLVSAALRVKQFLTFVNAGPLQPAVAVALDSPPSYYEQFRDGLQRKRDRLCEGLTAAGFAVLRSEGTYFVTADITPLGGTDGVDFCLALPERCGVVAVPTQVFYDDASAGRHIVRFAFCKRDEVIEEAITRLRRL